MGLARFGAGDNNFCGGCGASNADGCSCAARADTTSAAATPSLSVARQGPLQWRRDPSGGRTRGTTHDGFELIVHDDGRWAVRRHNEVMVTASGRESTAGAAQLRVVDVYMRLRA